ncbi:MAG: PIN domain-containing protein [Patescibacteria group bacterium]
MAIRLNKFKRLLSSHTLMALDSMCFIYHFADHPRYAQLTNQIFELLETGKNKATTSTISVIESLVLPEKQNNQLICYEYEKVFRNHPNLRILAVDFNISRLTAKLRAKYPFLKTPDAIQISSGLISGCSLFITNDKKLAKVKEITIAILDDYI